MFCYQCEQTAKGAGCTVAGVCGKSPAVSDMQDLLVHITKGISMYAHRAREFGVKDKEIDTFVVEALFSTITNVNFDEDRMEGLIKKAVELREKAKKLYEESCKKAGTSPEELTGPATFDPGTTKTEMISKGEEVTPAKGAEKRGEVIQGMHDLVLFGLKGSAAYADHARILGQEDDEVYGFFHDFLNFLSKDSFELDELVSRTLEAGKWNIRVMELLDKANTGGYGDPVPTKVRITPVKGKAILVSGHDLKDLELLLKQTEGKGINIYTHGEMLPCHGYPELKKYPHLVGNYGGAWQDQQKEFDEFPGAILMTTNCIQKPKESYKHRIFTTGLVAWPGVRHIGPDKDFTPVIEAALAEEGFKEDAPEKTIMVGFARNAVLSVAPQVIENVKEGKIRHFFLIGGCDGAKSGRNYYTDLALKVPKDCVILTLACGKYRFNKLDFGDIDGIPRLLDVGQCNDAFSAVKIAQALAEAFETDINSLPLSLILSWYEQKAVCILLSLLYLGIRNMRLGPSLPAFVKPPVLEFLQKEFNLMPITTPEEDLKSILG
ncbi:hybrid cluster protein [Thermovirga lienii DSM 17291]|uniref:Hydroxylamine reductase n=1 Tax=Thermovirga lienii (strain ATCC BAA-1197 / DSM 17291 / Cas60314) TaxID=580340 RepID=G7V7V2_THELD|nr:hydroxylamine reductase [Thermovirga lienii]AER67356.1 hybrid cluster protein [Thermovirga lienii DSM 17291]